jgi:uncharacterized protein (DUF885 family)
MTAEMDTTITRPVDSEDTVDDLEVKWKSLGESRGRSYDRGKADALFAGLLALARQAQADDGSDDTRVAVLTEALKREKSEKDQLAERYRLLVAKDGKSGLDADAARIAAARREQDIQAQVDAEMDKVRAYFLKEADRYDAWARRMREHGNALVADAQRAAEDVFTGALDPADIPTVESIAAARQRIDAVVALHRHTMDALNGLEREVSEQRGRLVAAMSSAAGRSEPQVSPITV